MNFGSKNSNGMSEYRNLDSSLSIMGIEIYHLTFQYIRRGPYRKFRYRLLRVIYDEPESLSSRPLVDDSRPGA